MENYGTVRQKLHSLLQELRMICERPLFYKINCGCWTQCLDLLIPLSEELQSNNTSSSLNGDDLSDAFHQLESLFLKMKGHLEKCAGKEGKFLPLLLKQQILKSFTDLSSELQLCLKLLPLETLGVPHHVQEQVEQCQSLLASMNFCMDAPQEDFSERMEMMLMEIKKGVKLSHSMLVNVARELGLKSNQEILREASFLEKEKGRAHLRKEKGEEEIVNLLIILVTQMADDLAEQKRLQECARGVSIPADFRCPLSLELMSDPVIVASGQTYERTYIQQWLDQGNTTCPKTREALSHVNLIPNYIVKAFIVTWSETNGVSLPDHEKSQSIPYELLQSSNIQDNYRVNMESCPPVSLRSTGENPVESSSCHETVKTLEEGDFDSTHVADSNLHLHVFHSRNASSSSHVSCLDDSFAALTLPNDSSCDVSLASSTLAASVHHASVVSRRRADNDSLDTHSSGQSGADVAEDGDDGDNIRRVQALVQELRSPVTSTQSNAVKELRLLSKHTIENRILIANCGAIPHLVTLLHSEDPNIQENAVTALLNLSLNDNNKSEIAAANAITPLVHVLEVGTSAAKENAAGALYSLCVMDENKVAIGRLGAIEPLVDLLIYGSPQGKKDAVAALFNLSLHPENKPRIVEANAIRPLLRLMTDPASGLVEKAVMVIQNLAYIHLGRESIGNEGGIPALVEVVETGSQRGKESAAGALFRLCSHSGRFRAITLQEGAIPPLVSLARSGTSRAKEKATSLLRLFQEQRQGRPGPDDRRHL